MPNAFKPKQHQPNLNKAKWDLYYIDRVLKDKVVKTGDGEDDYTIVKVVVEDKRSIKETIDSQANDVGLNNILRKYALTGDESILPERAVDNGEVIDMTQMPQDLIEANNFYANQKALYDNLPQEITKGRSFSEFMTNFTQAEFNAYVAALAAAAQPKKEQQEGGNK